MNLPDYIPILGSTGTILEEQHGMSPSDLFVEDKRGEIKYNGEVLNDFRIENHVSNWYNQENQEDIDRLSSRFQENIDIAENRMEIDWNGTEDLYQETVSLEEGLDVISESDEILMAEESAYKATAALEKAVRDSLTDRMDKVIYQEGEGGIATPATVPEAMYGFTEKLDYDLLPEGWSVGHATAIADRYYIKESLKQELRHESGRTVNSQIERAAKGEEVEGSLEDLLKDDEYAQNALRELGFPDDEVDAEYYLDR